MKLNKRISLTVLFFTLIFTSCTSSKQIGSVNMISNRNVDPSLNYAAISTYSGGTNRELRKSRATTIEDAINQTVKKIPGGEFLMNAKIFLVDKKYYAVEGDVWGTTSNISYRGFKSGDKVTWKVNGSYKSGVIKSLTDDKSCLVETDSGNVVEKRYDKISKAN